MNEIKFMQKAISEAKKALKKGNIPIGSCIVHNNKIIAVAHNDDFWHAEILCIKKAQKILGKFLIDCKIFSTIKPCPMCLHAIKLTKIKSLIYGANNIKKINHNLEVISKIEEDSCKKLIQEFFTKKRLNKL